MPRHGSTCGLKLTRAKSQPRRRRARTTLCRCDHRWQARHRQGARPGRVHGIAARRFLAAPHWPADGCKQDLISPRRVDDEGSVQFVPSGPDSIVRGAVGPQGRLSALLAVVTAATVLLKTVRRQPIA
jgi:hypothetical protein